MPLGNSTVAFHLQDPTIPSRTLLDHLTEAAADANCGGGIFAFASARGVAALLDDPAFERLTTQADLGFKLIVGLDSITDVRALTLLANRASARPGLTAFALRHTTTTLFHPKLAWFRSDAGLTLIVGSGNLTPGGLNSNFEAFIVSQLASEDARRAEERIDDWIAHWRESLLAPDSPIALAMAQRNSGSERSLQSPMESSDDHPLEDPPSSGDIPGLILEVPRNAAGRMQLDIGQKFFRSFFGGERDRDKRILIQHVGHDGKLGELEPPRKIFGTKSRNYRFEASAGRGRDYPTRGRPIGVFLRMPDGTFRYHLLWPNDPGYHKLEELLTQKAGPSGTHIRRESITVADLHALWPDSPLLRPPSRG